MPVSTINGAALGNATTGIVTLGGTDASAYGGRLNVTNGGQASAFFWNFGIGSGHVGFGASSSNLKLYNTYNDGLLTSGLGIDIDIAGRALNPNQPAFSAAGQTATFNPGTRINFPQKIITSNRAVNYDGTNSRFTAPVAGAYFFGFAVWLFTTAGYKQLVFRRNGGDYIPSDTYLAMAHDVYTDDSVTVTLGAVIELAVNDFVEVGVRNSTNAVSVYGGHSFFYGYLIG
jgi:hypothetical protein